MTEEKKTLGEHLPNPPNGRPNVARWRSQRRVHFAAAVALVAPMLGSVVWQYWPDLEGLGFHLLGPVIALVVLLMVGWESPFDDARRKEPGHHPDRDVQALIDGTIDVSEYRARKEQEAAPTRQREGDTG